MHTKSGILPGGLEYRQAKKIPFTTTIDSLGTKLEQNWIRP